MKLHCQKCGTEKEFATHKEAYKEGWDFPPLCSVTTCGNCPSADLVLAQQKPKVIRRNPNDERPNPYRR